MQTVLIYSLVVVAITWIAGLLPLAGNWRQSQRGILTAFAGGILLGAAFLHMLPEAAEDAPHWIGPAALGGLLFVFVLERIIATHYCEHDHEGCDHFQMLGYAFYVGLSLHSIIDGVVLGSGTLIPRLGAIVFVAVAAHKLPVIFSLTSILLAGGFRERRVLVLIGLLSLTTPAGAFAAFLGLRNLGIEVRSIAVAVSAGTFIYVALTDVLPSVATEKQTRLKSGAAMIVGLVLMYGAGLLAHT
jgi:zinc and cadmium transporter